MLTLHKEMSPHELGSNGLMDLLGAWLSLLCLAHCTLVPLLPLLLAAIPWLADEAMHATLLIVITPVAVVALARGYRRHGRRSVLFGGALGLILLLSAAFMGEALEKPLSVTGSLVLCAAHLQNRRYRPLT